MPRRSSVRTERGGIVAQSGDVNPERVVVAGTLTSAPTATVGDSYAGATVGVLDYAFGNYELLPTSSPTLNTAGLSREAAVATPGGQLSVAAFNVENLAPSNPQTKFDRLAAYAVTNLASADVLALEEIQDNDGARRRHRGRPDGLQAHGCDHRGRRPGLQGGLDRPGRRFRWRPAGRQHPGRPPLPHRPRPGLRQPAGRYVDRGHHRHHRRGRRAAPDLLPRADRPDRPGLGQQPKTAGRRVHLRRTHGVRDRQPLRLQGR